MCPDSMSVVRPDGTTEEIMFDCGQSDVFQAPVGTPIEVTGDFATLSVSAGVTGNRHPGTGETVPPLEPGAYAKTVAITGHRDHRWLTVTIDDDGPGIPSSLREDVFKPFLRLDDARNQDEGGTGLGLAIARDIARSHGGDITLSDSPMGGLRATVRVPV